MPYKDIMTLASFYADFQLLVSENAEAKTESRFSLRISSKLVSNWLYRLHRFEGFSKYDVKTALFCATSAFWKTGRVPFPFMKLQLAIHETVFNSIIIIFFCPFYLEKRVS